MSAQQRRFWTAEEDAVMRADYGRAPKHDLATRLDRNVHALHYRAGKLGLRRPQAARIQWTPERLAILQAEYLRTPTRELSARLGATIPAIRQQARINGFHRPYQVHWTPEWDAILAHLAGIASSTVIAERLGISQTMVLRRAKRLGVPFRSAPALRSARDQAEIQRLKECGADDGLGRRASILLAWRMNAIAAEEAAVALGVPVTRLAVELGKVAAAGQAAVREGRWMP